MQVNFDAYDVTDVLTIELKTQGVYASESVCRCQIGCQSLNEMIQKEQTTAASNPVTNTAVQMAKTGAVNHNTTQLMFEEEGETSSRNWMRVNMVPQGVLWFRVLPFRETVAGMDGMEDF